MDKLLLSLLLYGQIVLGGTEVVFEERYRLYYRPEIIVQYHVDTKYFEYIGSIVVNGELKPLLTLRMEVI